ncbi:MAG: DUF4404 family protein [Acidimicrobiia bacterium]
MEKHLRRLLDELSGAIGRTRHHEDREELTRLHGEVERRLEGTGEKRHSGLVDALEKAEIRFESEHPTLGVALRDAVAVLSAAGI